MPAPVAPTHPDAPVESAAAPRDGWMTGAGWLWLAIGLVLAALYILGTI